MISAFCSGGRLVAAILSSNPQDMTNILTVDKWKKYVGKSIALLFHALFSKIIKGEVHF